MTGYIAWTHELYWYAKALLIIVAPVQTDIAKISIHLIHYTVAIYYCLLLAGVCSSKI